MDHDDLERIVQEMGPPSIQQSTASKTNDVPDDIYFIEYRHPDDDAWRVYTDAFFTFRSVATQSLDAFRYSSPHLVWRRTLYRRVEEE